MFDGLNPNQLKAIHTVNGRLLILAGAGSGKTRVLTTRMVYLIKCLGVSPKSILGLTFTNKAAAEMRHRVASMISPSIAKQISLCTFHSFCMQVLRDEIQNLGYTSQFTLYDEQDVYRLITLIARDILEREGELPSLAPTVDAIVKAKNKGLAPEEISETGSVWHDRFACDVYRKLQRSMRAYNAVDFDSLICLTVELFENHPKILDKYQERFRYIMIDEYQDTNPIQYRLASLLSAKYRNLCVVGDDDQSIYGWRGAEVRNILNFEGTDIVKLEQNYRSTNVILKAANAVIANNCNRHKKALWSASGEGELIEIFYAPNEMEEAQAVIFRMDHIRQAHKLRWSDIAILYRSNALSRNLEMALMKHLWRNGECWVRGVPYQVFGGTEFCERSEVKDLFAYLRVIVNPLDQEAILRVINQPRRGIGEAALDILTKHNRSQNIPLWEVLIKASNLEFISEELPLHRKAMNGLYSFVQTIQEAKQRFVEMSLHEAMKWLIEKINYKKAIFEEVKSDQMRAFKWENVEAMASSLAEYEKNFELSEGSNPSLYDFVSRSPLKERWDKKIKVDKSDCDQVNLMTLHSAKGLEFTACFLIGMEDHIIPHEKSLLQTGVDEERRLFYVGITRAKRFLTMSMACQRKRMGQNALSRPSRFLQEISKELIKITKWDQVDLSRN